ncbi:hypothetical protein [Nocardia suismassiliense]|nr:hypothetical protein [Nocardia suismassiliense]
MDSRDLFYGASQTERLVPGEVPDGWAGEHAFSQDGFQEWATRSD